MLTSSEDIYYLGDTIWKGQNLLDYELAEIETHTVSRNSSDVSDSYIFWINKANETSFYQDNCCYHTIYVSSKTEHNYSINDSTVILIGN